MANGMSLLEQLLLKGGQAIGKGVQRGAQVAAPFVSNPNLMLNLPGAGFLERAGQLTQQAKGQQALSPLEQEEGEKVLRKAVKQQAEEMIQQQGSRALEQALAGQKPQQAQVQAPATQTQAISPQSTTTQTPAKTTDETQTMTLDTPEKQQNFLQSLGNFLFQAGGVDEEGVVQPAKLLGGLIQTSSEDLLRRQQQLALTPKAKGQEVLVKAQLDMLTEEYKQDRLDQREVLKSKLEEGGLGGASATLGGAISDVISAWDDVSLKGRFGGRLGGLAGAFGFERGKRAAFQSFAGSLSWKFAEHVLGQKGRAFTENERKDVEKRIIGATLSQTESEFKARMNAIIKQANNRIPEGKEKMPDYETIRNIMKSAKSSGNSNIKSITPIEE